MPQHHLNAKNWLKHILAYHIHCQIVLYYIEYKLHNFRFKTVCNIVHVTLFLISASPRGKIRSTNKKWRRNLSLECSIKKSSFLSYLKYNKLRKSVMAKIWFAHYSQLLSTLGDGGRSGSKKSC